jgi:hypothetical protein
MAISSEQWTVINTKLQNQFAVVQFALDGRKITVQWRRSSQTRIQYSLFVFIDEKIRISTGWPSHGDYDSFVKKVWRKKTCTTSLFKKQDLNGKSKRQIAIMNKLKKEYPDTVMVWYEPFFSSSSTFVNQFKKLEGLEYVQPENNHG